MKTLKIGMLKIVGWDSSKIFFTYEVSLVLTSDTRFILPRAQF